MKIEVYGHPVGRFLVKSKFNRAGTTRSMNDLEWALRTFKLENPSMGVFGLELESYFKKGDSVQFFYEQKVISKMMKFLEEGERRRARLTDLKKSISFSDDRSGKEYLIPKESQLVDDSFFCENGDIPDKR